MEAVRSVTVIGTAIAMSVVSLSFDRRTAGPQRSVLMLTDAGNALVAMPGESPRELSGLTYAGGDRYYAVSDSNRSVYPFAITLNRTDGRILSVTREEPIVLRDERGSPSGGTDFEGIAFDQASQQVVVLNESGLA